MAKPSVGHRALADREPDADGEQSEQPGAHQLHVEQEKGRQQRSASLPRQHTRPALLSGRTVSRNSDRLKKHNCQASTMCWAITYSRGTALAQAASSNRTLAGSALA